ncbi:3-methyladenine DNA glycosylase [Rhodococcus rhodnii]|uniref:3-methyladenine DNA glycosylase n=2 Tax=Rhodococcus rhodnii TaxID=38312 RepID=R7WIK8_9NOCA|nr:hypothetical protein [Rhodococcus rhodnii]EOM75040.1 hypothetical protein Rrhod_3653 [Rhodococcus rhodnii LMG 5362]TXG91143.1 3-methyladenine DNA glycosylase [Rhodococcus rhodnii]
MTDGEAAQATAAHVVLDREEWTARRDAHDARAARYTEPHVARRAAGIRHPIEDFLFTYYSNSPGRLRRWHPGHGVALADADEYAERSGYGRAGGGLVAVTDATLRKRLDAVRFVADLLAATASRPAVLGCFGLHEWAMVYRAGVGTNPDVRHEQVPLRLSRADTDAVVESLPLRCTHFDAFRFFTPDAAPRNERTLVREDQLASEQPGCLHAGMDLYKWAYKLVPLVDSELVMDCFEHALATRELDMAASPYDLREYGRDPVRIEEPAGRAEYVRRQQELARDASVLRERLGQRCATLLGAAERRECSITATDSSV